MQWKKDLYDFALRTAHRFEKNPLVAGVAIGGSIARRQTWKHSDLELGVISKKNIKDLEYFNVYEGKGVEIFQFNQKELEKNIEKIEKGELDIGILPIQMYKCRIIYDKKGLFARFKNILDKDLFSSEIVKNKKESSVLDAKLWCKQAKKAFSGGCYKSCVALLRLALNDLLLAFYWHNNVLPRSQTRTVYILKKLCKKINDPKFYNSFCRIYGLNLSLKQAKKRIKAAKKDIQEISRAWGKNTAQFLEKAVDGKLEWGHYKSVLSVYRFCTHYIQLAEKKEKYIYDDLLWSKQHKDLEVFLGLEKIDKKTAQMFLKEIKCLSDAYFK